MLHFPYNREPDLHCTVRLVYEANERQQCWMQLVCGQQDFLVAVSASISMYALGIPFFELEVIKLINCLHFHPVREVRGEQLHIFTWKTYINCGTARGLWTEVGRAMPLGQCLSILCNKSSTALIQELEPTPKLMFGFKRALQLE